MKSIKISVDVMGGDHGLPVTLPACVKAVTKNNYLTLVLVGDEDLINHNLQLMSIDPSVQKRLIVQHASEVVTMDELPSSALRTKKDSSMRVAINLVKEEVVQACVSSGNTGALMATAKFVLKTLPGIDRPAIVAELPTFNGVTRAMDLGANVDSCAEHLFQFAVMGSALIRALDKKARPSIGLLNIGVEEVKGNDQVKRTAHMLSQCSLINYVGYVEGDAFYSGVVDLVICDGFVGNTALKASEGIAKLMLRVLKSSFQRNKITRLIGFLSRPILNILKEKLDPARYNGASMLGLNGIVIKSHGSADEHAFGFAIDQAILQIENGVVDLVRDQITAFMDQGLLL